MPTFCKRSPLPFQAFSIAWSEQGAFLCSPLAPRAASHPSSRPPPLAADLRTECSPNSGECTLFVHSRPVLGEYPGRSNPPRGIRNAQAMPAPKRRRPCNSEHAGQTRPTPTPGMAQEETGNSQFRNRDFQAKNRDFEETEQEKHGSEQGEGQRGDRPGTVRSQRTRSLLVSAKGGPVEEGRRAERGKTPRRAVRVVASRARRRAPGRTLEPSWAQPRRSPVATVQDRPPLSRHVGRINEKQNLNSE